MSCTYCWASPCKCVQQTTTVSNSSEPATPKPPRDAAKNVWLRIGNCEKPGRFLVVAEVNGGERNGGYEQVLYDSVDECDGNISQHNNLTWLLGELQAKYDELIADVTEEEHERHKAIGERNQWREAAEEMATVIDHAMECGHFTAGGSTIKMAIDALANYAKLKKG